MNAAAYARYSTANQTENSIEYQLAKIRAFCLERGISLTAVFTDEARSGTNTNRPGFLAMLDAALSFALSKAKANCSLICVPIPEMTSVKTLAPFSKPDARPRMKSGIQLS